MTRGLVKKNNLSDLQNVEQARTNLGWATQDYIAIRGLYVSSGVRNTDIQKIANSNGNFQSQINASTTSLTSIVPALYASQSGDTLTGTWTNQGAINANAIINNGTTLSGSISALFSRSLPLSSFGLETLSGITIASGVSVDRLLVSDNMIVSSGISETSKISIQVNGVDYKIDLA